jgi:pantoate--beta-alanine ligase
MTILRSVRDARRHLADIRSARRIGLVPTMGALHDGHVRCFETARQHADYVVGTIFVNPTQFNDPADLVRYPRDEKRDVDIAIRAGVDALFIPTVDDIYPPGDATVVIPDGAALGFEGEVRPGHFRGVATVCAKLFAITQPQIACFGQKDAQQVAVIRQLVRDLFFDIEIIVVPTVRDADGLALSSRNAYLSAEERARALAIPRALSAGLAAYERGEDPIAPARAALGGLAQSGMEAPVPSEVAGPVLSDVEGLLVDYVDIASLHGERTLVIAARAGKTRLIDNVPLDHPERANLRAHATVRGVSS